MNALKQKNKGLYKVEFCMVQSSALTNIMMHRNNTYFIYIVRIDNIVLIV